MKMKFVTLSTLTVLATGITLGAFVDSAAAFPFGGIRPPQENGVDFGLKKSSSDDDKDAITNLEVTGISIFITVDDEKELTDDEQELFNIITSGKSTLAESSKNIDLEVNQSFPDLNIFNDIDVVEDDDIASSGFFDITGTSDINNDGFVDEEDIQDPIYEFSFVTEDLQLTDAGEFLVNNSDGYTEEDIIDDFTVTWFVPSKFALANDDGELVKNDDEETIEFDLFLDSDPSLLPDENNLAQIFAVAANNGISQIAFPSEVTGGSLNGLNGNFISGIVFETNSSQGETPKSTPEANTLVGILTLGVLGIITRCKRRIR